MLIILLPDCGRGPSSSYIAPFGLDLFHQVRADSYFLGELIHPVEGLAGINNGSRIEIGLRRPPYGRIQGIAAAVSHDVDVFFRVRPRTNRPQDLMDVG